MSQDFPEADSNTREFLHRVIDILLDYVSKSNDRTTKILDFHHPDQMKQSIDLDLPEKPLNLDQLLVDCKDTMKYGVKTGKDNLYAFNLVFVELYSLFNVVKLNWNLYKVIRSFYKLVLLHLCKISKAVFLNIMFNMSYI